MRLVMGILKAPFMNWWKGGFFEIILTPRRLCLFLFLIETLQDIRVSFPTRIIKTLPDRLRDCLLLAPGDQS